MYMNIWMQVPKITQKGWKCTKYQRWATLVTGPWPPDHIPWPADHGWWPPDHPPGWNGVYDHVEWSHDHFMCHVIDPVSNKHKMVKIQPYNSASNISKGHNVPGQGLVMSRIRGGNELEQNTWPPDHLGWSSDHPSAAFFTCTN